MATRAHADEAMMRGPGQQLMLAQSNFEGCEARRGGVMGLAALYPFNEDYRD